MFQETGDAKCSGKGPFLYIPLTFEDSGKLQASSFISNVSANMFYFDVLSNDLCRFFAPMCLVKPHSLKAVSDRRSFTPWYDKKLGASDLRYCL